MSFLVFFSGKAMANDPYNYILVTCLKHRQTPVGHAVCGAQCTSVLKYTPAQHRSTAQNKESPYYTHSTLSILDSNKGVQKVTHILEYIIS